MKSLERFFKLEWALTALMQGGAVYAFEDGEETTGGIVISQRDSTLAMIGEMPTEEHWKAAVSICDKELEDRGAVKVVYQGVGRVLSEVFRPVGVLLYENWTGGELSDMFIGELLNQRLRDCGPEEIEPVGELIALDGEKDVQEIVGDGESSQ